MLLLSIVILLPPNSFYFSITSTHLCTSNPHSFPISFPNSFPHFFPHTADQKWWLKYKSHLLSHGPPPGPIDNSGLFDRNHTWTSSNVSGNGDSLSKGSEENGNGVINAPDLGNGTTTHHASNDHATDSSNGHASPNTALSSVVAQSTSTPRFPLGSEPYLNSTLRESETYQLIPSSLHTTLKSRYGALNELPRRVVKDTLQDQDVIDALGWRVKWKFKEEEGELVVDKVRGWGR